MIGPTGVGKTEIARRLATLAQAPFLKVEATKFTEVGFHGRDVDTIIRDLMDVSINLTRKLVRQKIKKELQTAVENRILDALCGPSGDPSVSREPFRTLLQEGQMEDRMIEVELPNTKGQNPMDNIAGQLGLNEFVIKFDPRNAMKKGSEKRKMKVSECRALIEEAESERLIPPELVQKDALTAVEQNGIVFIDEIDKICQSSSAVHHADASSEGVQRDLLPLIEGSTISTKYGNVNTDHILFVCSGAFHHCKPSDLLPELQGRLPIRVELKGLTEGDMHRILTEPEFNLIRQQISLMDTENVKLTFTDDAIQEVARVSAEVNATVENIGARRLHTVVERLVEELSFDAPDKAGTEVFIDKSDVVSKVSDLLKKADLSKFVL